MDARLAIVRLASAAVCIQAGVADAADWECPRAPYNTGVNHALFVQGCSYGDGAWCPLECEAGYDATTPWTETDANGIVRKNSYFCHCENAAQCGWMRGAPPRDLGCQPVGCPAESPAPDVAKCGAGVYNQACDATCELGYSAVPGGSGHYTCSAKGRWEGGSLECTATQDFCASHAVAPHAVLEPGCTKSTVHSVCTAECVAGYERVNGEAVYKCDTDGVWKPEAEPLQCEQRCSEVSPVAHSTLLSRGCDRAPGGTGDCEARCDPGYSASGTNPRYKCDQKARWGGGDLTCTLSGCGESLPPVTSHAVQCASAHINDTCTARCSAGYSGSGSADYTCTRVGAGKPAQWTGGSLVCGAIPSWCADAPSAGYGIDVSHCSQAVGSTCLAKCRNGSAPAQGVPQYRCGADAGGRPEWAPTVSQDPLVCEDSCGTNVPADHAQLRSGCGFLSRRRCLAECVPGFSQVGGAESYACQNGTWQEGSLECARPCEPGSARTKTNSTGVSTHCAPCDESQFSADGTECRDCLKTDASRTRCFKCLAEQGPNQEHTACEQCRADLGLVSVGGVCRSNDPIVQVHDWIQQLWDSSDEGEKAVEVVGLVLGSVLLLCICGGVCRWCFREGKPQEQLAAVLRASFLGGSGKLPGAKLALLDVQARWSNAEREGCTPTDGEDRPRKSVAVGKSGATRRRKKDSSTDVYVMFTNEHMRELQPSAWKQEPVGFGTYGTVYKASWRGRDVAVKVLKLPERTADATEAANSALRKKVEEITKDFVTEVEICADLNHPNLVRLLGYADHPSLVLVHELLRGKSLDQQLYIENWKPSHRQVLLAGLDVARGMDYLHTRFLADDNIHDQPIIHRDLKTPNLLLVEEQPGTEDIHLKIADFGLSRDKGLDEANYSQTVLMTGCGSVLWMAPEVLLGQKYNEKVDVYSYAMCMVEMVDCKLPWAGSATGAEVPNRVTRGDRPERQLIDCEDDLRDLIQQCWSQSPQRRPEFGDVVSALEAMLGLPTQSSRRRRDASGTSSGRRSSGSRSVRRAHNPLGGGLTLQSVEEDGSE